MDFDAILAQVREQLKRERRIAYRMLKRRFQLTDEDIEDLKADLIDAKQLAVDEKGKVLVWVGEGETGLRDVVPPSASIDRLLSPGYASEQPHPTAHRVSTGERRQLTVMFCDLVGSTALSERLDPEELHTLIQAYQAACGQIVEQYDGTIAQYLGDGLLVYFGYPSAHEDDARRAVRAGLDILKQIPQLPATIPLQVRIGLHTGPVVVGEIGQGDKREQLALGETPNIAARIQSQAEPHTLVISASTYRLVQGFFTCHELGQHQLKGLSTPVTLYQVQGEGTAQTSFEVSLQKGLTPLVGREEEVELLRRRWERTVAGDGQVVLISGEAGIGKSRLLQVLKDAIAHEAHWSIEAGCSPFYQNTALYPVTDQLQRFLQSRREDTAAEKHHKLANTLRTVGLASAESLALVANLLSIPATEGQAPLNLSAQKQKEKTLEVLVTWVEREAERQPVLLMIEDLHWADPSTLELLHLLIERVSTIRVLVVLTFRPEFRPPWPMRGYSSTLTLSRLLHQQIEVMASRVAGEKTLPKEIIDQLVAKTDGVPLFVEELTKSILESDALQEREDHYELIGPLTDLHIPSTLQDSLMARLDRLNIARDIAQFGAVLGREFSYELLYATTDIEEDRLRHGLMQLIEAELVYVQGFPPDARYTFKHALVQDAAYDSLLKSTRREQHRRVAEVLIERFADTVERQPELVAHHYTEAELIDQAVPYWQKAGRQAIARSAHIEAINYPTKGLTLLEAMPNTPTWAQYELTMQVDLGNALTTTKGIAAPEVKEVYTRALQLCQRIGETPELAPVLEGLSAFYPISADLPTGRQVAEQILSMAQRVQDPTLFLAAYHELAFIRLYSGAFSSALPLFEKGVALYDPKHHHALALHYVGHDPGMCLLSNGAFAQWMLGYSDQAAETMQQALRLSRDISHPFSLANALGFSAMFYQFNREVEQAQTHVEELIALSTEQGFAFTAAWGTIMHGWAIALLGRGQEGIAQIKEGLGAWRATGSELFRPYFLALLAETNGITGRVEEGLAVLSEALVIVNKTEERIWESELYRLKGELTVRLGEEFTDETLLQEAEQCFHEAIDIAQQQQAKSWELRVAMSLARLWQQQGKKAEAHQLLAEVYSWFTEGFDTQDLQEAKTLLGRLGEN